VTKANKQNKNTTSTHHVIYFIHHVNLLNPNAKPTNLKFNPILYTL